MAYDIDLAERVRRWFRLKGVSVEEKKMMGGLCFMVDGKMCLGVESERLMVRLDPDIYESALRDPACAPMDSTGRPLKGFVWVNLDAVGTDSGIDKWAALALEFNPRAKSSKTSKTRKRRNRS